MNTPDSARFVAVDEPADIAVVVVTYNSADDIEALIDSLRPDAATLGLRLIVADNGSADRTADIVAAHTDVILVPTGGNRGYAGGINAAMRHAGDADSIMILNPDLRVGTGAIRTLRDRLNSDPSLGIVVPRILDEDGGTSWSLRCEPNLVRAASDALFGRRWLNRPAALSEYIRDQRQYESPRLVDWATGAAMLIRRETADQVGQWDERFFLYSEETDFFRRSRTAGWQTLYEPEASVTHRGGGSGVSNDLVALTVVNRVRYIDKHRPASSGLYRGIVILAEQLRRGDPTHARARWALRRRSRWDQLPGPSWDEVIVEHFPRCAVIIPAHNEAAVIERTLRPLSALVEAGQIELVVACNGCTDDTASRAGSIAGVSVVEVPEASKTAALNAGDEAATLWPRVYLDADITLTPRALSDIVECLEDGEVPAARPAAIVDTSRSSPAVRRYYRARERMPSLSAHLWGAGVYALSKSGHDRFGVFPDVIADDFYVDSMFGPEEKMIIMTEPVVVHAPLNTRGLVAVFTRARRGPAQQATDTGTSTARALARSIRGPQSAWDAATFAWFALRARLKARQTSSSVASWERDDSTRQISDGAVEEASIDHVILTRFNLPTPGPESLVRAREGWLRERIDLFERYTVPSVARQSVQDFRWIVYLDPESPSWLVERLAPHIESGLFTPLYRESVTWQNVAADVRALSGARRSLLLTTNLDNDDAVAGDFVERLQRLARVHRHAALFLGRGLIAHDDEVYLRRDDENAFCSVVESWDAPQTAWRDWHTLLHTHFSVVTDGGRPAWLQVVHRGNVSNRVRGMRVSPISYDEAFGDALVGTAAPRLGTLATDRLVRFPVRTVTEEARRAGKDLLLRVLGKDGLDRLKERLATQ